MIGVDAVILAPGAGLVTALVGAPAGNQVTSVVLADSHALGDAATASVPAGEGRAIVTSVCACWNV